MNSIKILNLAIFLLMTVLSSCSEEWLDPKPLSFYAPENVYVDEAGFEALLITMSKDIKSEFYAERGPISNEHAMSDLGVPGAQANNVVKDFPQVLTPAGDGGNHDFPGRLFNLSFKFNY